jgi:hypothetical protein
MSTISWPRTRVVAVIGGAAIVVLVVVGLILATNRNSQSTALTPAASVLSPSYARSAGFPKTLQTAKKTSVTDEKGCTNSVEAVYEDTEGQTGLISDVLNCKSVASASTALAAARKQVATDRSMTVPKELGTSAFASASNAPEYLVVWQAGTRVAITAIDVDIAASANTSSTAASHPLTKSQGTTLGHAALEQNSLYP